MNDHTRFIIDFFEHAPVSFTLFDENLKVIYLNNIAVELMRFSSKEEAIGMSIAEISPDIKESGRLAVYQNVLKTGKPAQLRSIVLHPRMGNKNIGTYGFKLGTGLAIIAIEVTEWVEEEQAMIKQLELRNKELEQFAYVASHDLQEPLETINSFVGVLQKKYESKLDETGNKYIGFIVQAAKRMQVLVRNVLEYSRIGKKEAIEKINLDELIGEVAMDLDATIKANEAKILTNGLPSIRANRIEMKQLFQNLISNAIKFKKPDASPLININAERENGWWKFSVADNGIGIDEKFYDRIFVIFQRLHNRSQYDGTGIGLSLCKKMVEINGGKIWLNSEPGNGSTFYFTLKESMS